MYNVCISYMEYILYHHLGYAGILIINHTLDSSAPKVYNFGLIFVEKYTLLLIFLLWIEVELLVNSR